VTNDIETLITALYVKIDDELSGPRWVGRPPVLTDSELVCLAAAQALLGFTSEAHWLRYARKHLAGMFPYLPQQSGYNKRLRAALGLVKRVIRMLARSSDFWLDDCWIADSTPCSRSFTLRMWVSLVVRMAWHGAAPPAGAWRGRGVRAGGVVVSLT
jgi:hypothetical protein